MTCCLPNYLSYLTFLDLKIKLDDLEKDVKSKEEVVKNAIKLKVLEMNVDKINKAKILNDKIEITENGIGCIQKNWEIKGTFEDFNGFIMISGP